MRAKTWYALHSKVALCFRDFPSPANRTSVGKPALVLAVNQREARHLAPIARGIAHAGRRCLLCSPGPSRDLVEPHLFADAARELSREIWVTAPQIHAVAYRRGLYLALELFRRHRSDVATIVSVCGRWPASGGRLADLLRAHSRVRAMSRGPLATWLNSATTRPTTTGPGSNGRLRTKWAEWRLARSMAGRHASDIVEQLDLPVLVLSEPFGRSSTQSTARELAFAVPSATWETLPHPCSGSKTAASGTADRIARFLASCDET